MSFETLIEEIRKGNVEAVNSLLQDKTIFEEANAKPNLVYIALYRAASEGRLSVDLVNRILAIPAALEIVANNNNQLLDRAALLGDLPVVHLLLSNRKVIGELDTMITSSNNGLTTTLQNAARNNHIDVMFRILIAYKTLGKTFPVRDQRRGYKIESDLQLMDVVDRVDEFLGAPPKTLSELSSLVDCVVPVFEDTAVSAASTGVATSVVSDSYYLLLDAIRKGNVEAVNSLLQDEAILNAAKSLPEFITQALYIADTRGLLSPGLVNRILEIPEVLQIGCQTLTYAIRQGYIETVNVLLQNKTILNEVRSNPKFIFDNLLSAALRGHLSLSLVNRVLEIPEVSAIVALEGNLFLNRAALLGDLSVVHRLLSNSAVMRELDRRIISSNNNPTNTALGFAAVNKDIDVLVRILISYKALGKSFPAGKDYQELVGVVNIVDEYLDNMSSREYTQLLGAGTSSSSSVATSAIDSSTAKTATDRVLTSEPITLSMEETKMLQDYKRKLMDEEPEYAANPEDFEICRENSFHQVVQLANNTAQIDGNGGDDANANATPRLLMSSSGQRAASASIVSVSAGAGAGAAGASAVANAATVSVVGSSGSISAEMAYKLAREQMDPATFADFLLHPDMYELKPRTQASGGQRG